MQYTLCKYLKGVKICIIGFALLGTCGCRNFRIPARTPSSFILINNYEGAVFIEYGMPEEPLLAERDGYNVVTVPANGLVKTSSKFLGGRSLPNRFYYQNKGVLKELSFGQQDQNNMIWNHHNGIAKCPDRQIKHEQYEFFYVTSKKSDSIHNFNICEFLRKRDPKSFKFDDF